MKHNKAAHIIGSISRTLLALTFLFSGFVKAVDPLGTTYKIEDYLHAFGGFFVQLDTLAYPAALTLIAFEFLLGFCLLFNIRTQIMAWLALIMMLFMTPLTLYIAIENPVSDCGCFGDAIVLSNWATFWKNIVLLTLVIILLLTKRHIPQLFVGAAEGVLFTIGVLGLLSIILVSQLSLPFIDFRPYKVGNHIPTLMEYPEDAEPDVYETTFVYAQDGIEQEFTIDNYPQDDSTWVFVRQNTTLIKKGYEPPIHDFEIMDYDFNDITDEVLTSEEPVTLVIMYDLAKADTEQLTKVETLWEKGNCHILTGSTSDEIATFCSEHFNNPDIEYAFCATDPVTLKTIVRANPGVIVVKDGFIIEKYNLKNK